MMRNLPTTISIYTLLCVCLLLIAHAHGNERVFATRADSPPDESFPSTRSSVPIDSLITAINSGNIDRILKETNRIKSLHYKGAALDAVYALWREDKTRFPDLRWDIAKLAIVRVEIANILLQAWKNGVFSLTEDDRAQMQTFLHHVINNAARDFFLVGNAISTLALLNDREDVELILEIVARHRSSIIFRQAALALITMCLDEAQQALKKLPMYATTQADKEFLQRLDDDSARLRRFWCND